MPAWPRPMTTLPRPQPGALMRSPVRTTLSLATSPELRPARLDHHVAGAPAFAQVDVPAASRVAILM